MSYQGEPILRKAFADWYKRYYNVEVDYRSEVLPLLGSKEGLMHICQTFLNVGDKVLVPNPGYPTYSAAVKLSGGVMVTYSLNKETGFLPDFEAIEAAGLEGVKMMLVNYPNMPTGQTPTPDLFEKLVAFGAKHNILIIHDNPYSFVRNPQPMSILQVEGAMEVAMELNSLSKGHSMAGWRVGAIFAKKEWIDAILCFKSNMDSGMFYPMQAAAAVALTELGEEWYNDLNAMYHAREKQGYELLDALGCSYRKGQAGLFIWAELPESYEGDSFQFSDEVMEKCDVFVTPGAIFGSEGKRYVRITLCCPAELLEKAAQRVRERLNK